MKIIIVVLGALSNCALGGRFPREYIPPGPGSGYFPSKGAFFPQTGAGVSKGYFPPAAGAGGFFPPNRGGYHNQGGYFNNGGGGFGPHIPILNYENINNGDGHYRYNYDTANGISVHEEGHPSVPGPEGPAVTARGGYSYTGPDGVRYSITYTADENGFHPSGAHLPTPPPIPGDILKSLGPAGSGNGYYSGNAGYNHNKYLTPGGGYQY